MADKNIETPDMEGNQQNNSEKEEGELSSDDEYQVKLTEMRTYIPFLQQMIQRLEQCNDKTREAQLSKMKSLYGILNNTKKKLKIDALKRCEDVLKSLMDKVEKLKLPQSSGGTKDAGKNKKKDGEYSKNQKNGDCASSVGSSCSSSELVNIESDDYSPTLGNNTCLSDHEGVVSSTTQSNENDSPVSDIVKTLKLAAARNNLRNLERVNSPGRYYDDSRVKVSSSSQGNLLVSSSQKLPAEKKDFGDKDGLEQSRERLKKLMGQQLVTTTPPPYQSPSETFSRSNEKTHDNLSPVNDWLYHKETSWEHFSSPFSAGSDSCDELFSRREGSVTERNRQSANYKTYNDDSVNKDETNNGHSRNTDKSPSKTESNQKLSPVKNHHSSQTHSKCTTDYGDDSDKSDNSLGSKRVRAKLEQEIHKVHRVGVSTGGALRSLVNKDEHKKSPVKGKADDEKLSPSSKSFENKDRRHSQELDKNVKGKLDCQNDKLPDPRKHLGVDRSPSPTKVTGLGHSTDTGFPRKKPATNCNQLPSSKPATDNIKSESTDIFSGMSSEELQRIVTENLRNLPSPPPITLGIIEKAKSSPSQGNPTSLSNSGSIPSWKPFNPPSIDATTPSSPDDSFHSSSYMHRDKYSLQYGPTKHSVVEDSRSGVLHGSQNSEDPRFSYNSHQNLEEMRMSNIHHNIDESRIQMRNLMPTESCRSRNMEDPRSGLYKNIVDEQRNIMHNHMLENPRMASSHSYSDDARTPRRNMDDHRAGERRRGLLPTPPRYSANSMSQFVGPQSNMLHVVQDLGQRFEERTRMNEMRMNTHMPPEQQNWDSGWSGSSYSQSNIQHQGPDRYQYHPRDSRGPQDLRHTPAFQWGSNERHIQQQTSLHANYIPPYQSLSRPDIPPDMGQGKYMPRATQGDPRLNKMDSHLSSSDQQVLSDLHSPVGDVRFTSLSDPRIPSLFSGPRQQPSQIANISRLNSMSERDPRRRSIEESDNSRKLVQEQDDKKKRHSDNWRASYSVTRSPDKKRDIPDKEKRRFGESVRIKEELGKKSVTASTSPLDSLYEISAVPKTGKGYGFQHFRIPKIKRESSPIPSSSHPSKPRPPTPPRPAPPKEKYDEEITEYEGKVSEAKKGEEKDCETVSKIDTKENDCQMKEVTQELIESLIRKSFESGEGKKLFEHAKFLEKLSENLKAKKIRKIKRILESESEDSSSSSDDNDDKDKVTQMKKKKKNEDESGKKEVADSTTSTILKELVSASDSDDEPLATKLESKQEKESKISDQKENIISTKLNECQVVKDDTVKTDSSENILEINEGNRNEGKGNDVKNEKISDTEKEEVKPAKKPAAKRRNALELLQQDVRDMFIREGVVTATGYRMCRLLKEVQSGASLEEISQNEAKRMEDEAEEESDSSAVTGTDKKNRKKMNTKVKNSNSKKSKSRLSLCKKSTKSLEKYCDEKVSCDSPSTTTDVDVGVDSQTVLSTRYRRTNPSYIDDSEESDRSMSPVSRKINNSTKKTFIKPLTAKDILKRRRIPRVVLEKANISKLCFSAPRSSVADSEEEDDDDGNNDKVEEIFNSLIEDFNCSKVETKKKSQSKVKYGKKGKKKGRKISAVSDTDTVEDPFLFSFVYKKIKGSLKKNKSVSERNLNDVIKKLHKCEIPKCTLNDLFSLNVSVAEIADLKEDSNVSQVEESTRSQSCEEEPEDKTDSVSLLDRLKEAISEKVSKVVECSKSDEDIVGNSIEASVESSSGDITKNTNKEIEEVTSTESKEKATILNADPEEDDKQEEEEACDNENSMQSTLMDTAVSEVVTDSDNITTDLIIQTSNSENIEENRCSDIQKCGGADTSKLNTFKLNLIKRKFPQRKKKRAMWQLGIIRKKTFSHKLKSCVEDEVVKVAEETNNLGEQKDDTKDSIEIDDNDYDGDDSTQDSCIGKITVNEISSETVNTNNQINSSSEINKHQSLCDIDYVFNSLSRQTNCLLCPYEGKSIVQHYKQVHADSEVLIARLPADEACRSISESVEKEFDNDEIVSSLMSGKRKSASFFSCRFCNYTAQFAVNFYEHTSSHTGEYRYQCCKCLYMAASRTTFKGHFYNHHPQTKLKQGLNLKVLVEGPSNSAKIVFGYICSKCHFTQLLLENIQKHIQLRHPEDGDAKIIRINMSRPSPNQIKDTADEIQSEVDDSENNSDEDTEMGEKGCSDKELVENDEESVISIKSDTDTQPDICIQKEIKEESLGSNENNDIHQKPILLEAFQTVSKEVDSNECVILEERMKVLQNINNHASENGILKELQKVEEKDDDDVLILLEVKLKEIKKEIDIEMDTERTDSSVMNDKKKNVGDAKHTEKADIRNAPLQSLESDMHTDTNSELNSGKSQNASTACLGTPAEVEDNNPVFEILEDSASKLTTEAMEIIISDDPSSSTTILRSLLQGEQDENGEEIIQEKKCKSPMKKILDHNVESTKIVSMKDDLGDRRITRSLSKTDEDGHDSHKSEQLISDNDSGCETNYNFDIIEITDESDDQDEEQEIMMNYEAKTVEKMQNDSGDEGVSIIGVKLIKRLRNHITNKKGDIKSENMKSPSHPKIQDASKTVAKPPLAVSINKHPLKGQMLPKNFAIRIASLLARRLSDGAILFSCLIQCCVFCTRQSTLMEKHLQRCHKREWWDGVCSTCDKRVYGENPLIDVPVEHKYPLSFALEHMITVHIAALPNSNKKPANFESSQPMGNDIPSKDPQHPLELSNVFSNENTSSVVSLETETNTIQQSEVMTLHTHQENKDNSTIRSETCNYIRTRRLSGDKLSGTKIPDSNQTVALPDTPTDSFTNMQSENSNTNILSNDSNDEDVPFLKIESVVSLNPSVSTNIDHPFGDLAISNPPSTSPESSSKNDSSAVSPSGVDKSGLSPLLSPTRSVLTFSRKLVSVQSKTPAKKLVEFVPLTSSVRASSITLLPSSSNPTNIPSPLVKLAQFIAPGTKMVIPKNVGNLPGGVWNANNKNNSKNSNISSNLPSILPKPTTQTYYIANPSSTNFVIAPSFLQSHVVGTSSIIVPTTTVSTPISLSTPSSTTSSILSSTPSSIPVSTHSSTPSSISLSTPLFTLSSTSSATIVSSSIDVVSAEKSPQQTSVVASPVSELPSTSQEMDSVYIADKSNSSEVFVSEGSARTSHFEYARKNNSKTTVNTKKKVYYKGLKIVEVIKAAKVLSVYHNMLDKDKLRHLFKCMARYCTFTTDSPSVFEKHCEKHVNLHRKLKLPVTTCSEDDSTQKGGVEVATSKTRNYLLMCAYCCTVPEDPKSLSEHIQKHHGHCLYQCAYCFFRAISYSYVVLHQNTNHTCAKITVLLCHKIPGILSPVHLKKERKQVVLPYICRQGDCGIELCNPAAFWRHLQSVHGSVSCFSCHICSGQYLNRDKLLTHYKLHSHCYYQCHYCVHGTDTKEEMRHHIYNSHPNEKPQVIIRDSDPNTPALGNEVERSVDCLSVISIEEDLKEDGLHHPLALSIEDYEETLDEFWEHSATLVKEHPEISVSDPNLLCSPSLPGVSKSDCGIEILSMTFDEPNEHNKSSQDPLSVQERRDSSESDVLMIDEAPSNEHGSVGPSLCSNATDVNQLLKEPSNIKSLTSSLEEDADVVILESSNSICEAKQPELIEVSESQPNYEPMVTLIHTNPLLRSRIESAVDPLKIDTLQDENTEVILISEQTRKEETRNIVDSVTKIVSDVDKTPLSGKNLTEVTEANPEIEFLEEEKMSDDVKDSATDKSKIVDDNQCLGTKDESPTIHVSITKLPAISPEILSHSTITSEELEKTGCSGDRLYRCGNNTCTYSAPNTSQLRDHLLICDLSRDSSGLICVHCQRPFKQITPYLEHLKVHGTCRYNCSLCKFRAPLPQQVSKHMKQKHRVYNTHTLPLDQLNTDPETALFVMCSKDKTKGRLLPHFRNKRTFNPEEVNYLPKKCISFHPLTCGVCNFRTKVVSNIRRHLNFHNNKSMDPACIPSFDPINPVPCLEKKEMMFDKMTNLAASSHPLGRMGAKPTSANSSNTSTSTEELNLPKFVPEHERYVCGAPGCNYLTCDETMLRYHLRALHFDETAYRCPHCPESLQQDTGGQVISIDRLGAHLKMHDSRLYKCAHCSYNHFQRHVVERHLSDKHPEKRPFVHVVREPEGESSSCTKQEDQLTEETTPISSAPWACGLCTARFVTRVEVLEHTSSTHGVKSQYKCGVCTFRSSSKPNCETHFLSRHPGETLHLITVYQRVDGGSSDTLISPSTSTSSELPSAKRFDTTPLWRRNMIRVRHIRGVLLEDEEESRRHLQKIEDAGCKKQKNKDSAGTPSSIPLDSPSITSDTEEKDPLELTYGPFGKPVLGNMYFCTICKKYKTRFKADMKEHLYRELNYVKWVCTHCNLMSCSRNQLQKHSAKVHERDHKPESIIPLKPNTDIEEWVDKLLAKQHYDMKGVPDASPRIIASPVSRSKNNVTSTLGTSDLKVTQSDTSPKKLLITDSSNNSTSIDTEDVPLSCMQIVQKRKHGPGTKDAENSEGTVCKRKCVSNVSVPEDNDEALNNDELNDSASSSMKDEKQAPQIIKMQYSCRDCKAAFSGVRGLKIHIRLVHLPLGSYICGHCKRPAHTETAVKQHLEVHHPNEPELIIYNKENSNVKLDDEFWEREYGIKPPTKTEDMPSAKKRKMAFQLTPETSSIPSSFPVPDGTSSSAVDSNDIVIVDDGTKKCCYCDYRCKSSSDLRNHEMRHWVQKPFKCGHCDFETIREYEIKKHSVKAHPSEYVSVVEKSLPSKPEIRPLQRTRRPGCLSNTTGSVKAETPLTSDSEAATSDNIDTDEVECLSQSESKLSLSSIASKKVFRCFYCPLRATSLGIVHQHWQKAHKTQVITDTGITVQGTPFRYKEGSMDDILKGKETSRKKSIYTCSYCNFKGTLKAVDTHHKQKHIGLPIKILGTVTKYECAECSFIAILTASLRKHFEAQHPGKEFRYMVHTATRLANTVDELQAENKFEGSEDSSAITSELLEGRHIHQSSSIKTIKSNSVSFKFVCGWCSDTCSTEEKMHFHHTMYHSHLDQKYSMERIAETVSENKSKIRIIFFSCPKCTFKVPSMDKMYDHLRKHSRPFKCGHCNSAYEFPTNVRCHSTIAHPNQQLRIISVKDSESDFAALKSLVTSTLEEVDPVDYPEIELSKYNPSQMENIDSNNGSDDNGYDDDYEKEVPEKRRMIGFARKSTGLQAATTKQKLLPVARKSTNPISTENNESVKYYFEGDTSSSRSTSPVLVKEYSYYGQPTIPVDMTKITTTVNYGGAPVQVNVATMSALVKLDPVVLVKDLRTEWKLL